MSKHLLSFVHPDAVPDEAFVFNGAMRVVGVDFEQPADVVVFRPGEGQAALIRFGADGTIVIDANVPLSASSIVAGQMAIRAEPLRMDPAAVEVEDAEDARERESVAIKPGDVGTVESLGLEL